MGTRSKIRNVVKKHPEKFFHYCDFVVVIPGGRLEAHGIDKQRLDRDGTVHPDEESNSYLDVVEQSLIELGIAKRAHRGVLVADRNAIILE